MSFSSFVIGGSSLLLVLVCAALRDSGRQRRSAKNSANNSDASRLLLITGLVLGGCDIADYAQTVQVTDAFFERTLVVDALPGDRVTLLTVDGEKGGLGFECTYVPPELPVYVDVYDPEERRHVLSLQVLPDSSGALHAELPAILSPAYQRLELHFALAAGDCLLGFRLDGSRVGFSVCENRPCGQNEKLDYGLGIVRDSYFAPGYAAPAVLINGVLWPGNPSLKPSDASHGMVAAVGRSIRQGAL